MGGEEVSRAQGELNKAEAIERVTIGNSDWVARAYPIACQVARRLVTLTSDDVWEAIPGAGPRERRAMGPVMQAMSRAGLTRPTGRYVRSRRAECNARPLREWTLREGAPRVDVPRATRAPKARAPRKAEARQGVFWA